MKWYENIPCLIDMKNYKEIIYGKKLGISSIQTVITNTNYLTDKDGKIRRFYKR